jgi:HEAT repeat protein
MGTVYLAEDSRLSRRVALKVCLDAGANPEALERFRREARAAAALRHPNICPVYDCDVAAGVPYLTMAYIEGPTLADQLARRGAFPPREAAQLVCKLALAMAEAHAEGVIHRDLKPANVALDRRGEPVILDFGLARRTEAASATLTRVGAILGTPAYMAPEQVQGQAEAIGPKCDIYSLGVLLYELLTARPPFLGPVHAVLAQVLYADTPRPSEAVAGLDPHLDAICRTAMAKNPAERYAGMKELASALSASLRKRALPEVRPGNSLPETLPTAKSGPQAATPPGRPAPGFRLGWLGLALVAVLAVSGTLIWSVKALQSRGGAGAKSQAEPAGRTVPELVALLREGDRAGRREAALALADRHQDAAPALLPLAAALRDDAEEVRAAAAVALLRIGPPCLRGADAAVRTSAAHALGELDARAEEVLPHLADALKDGEKEVRTAAAEGLVKIAPRCLAAQKAEVRRRVVGALGDTGALAQPLLPQLTEAYKDPDGGVRAAVVTTLARVNPAAEEVFGVFLAGLADGDAPVRAVSAQALAQATPAQRRKAAIPLAKCLDDRSRQVRETAVTVLADYGPDALPADAGLQKALHDPEPAVRRGAVRALGRLGTAATAVNVSALCATLLDNEALVRQEAVAALAAIGRPLAAPAVRHLAALAATEPDRAVRKLALAKLADLAGPADSGIAPQLTPLLESDDGESARLAAFVLASLGGKYAVPALPVLCQVLKQADMHAQELASTALARIGPEASPAVPDLARALGDSKSAVVRRNSALALSRIGPEAKAAVPELVRSLDASEPADVRSLAAEALARIRYPGTEKAIPVLLEAIQKDPDKRVRQRCIWALFDVEDLERCDAVRPLTNVLQEKGHDALIVRYDAARVLAFRLGDMAPDATADLLLAMLNDKGLAVYEGPDTSGSGQTEVKEKAGGDARFLAAQALSMLGAKAKNRKDVMDALEAATKDDDKKLREEAAVALQRL